MAHKIAMIGTGANPDNPSTEGYAMAYRHAEAYRRLESCELVACADIIIENARQFATRFDILSDHVYEDYEQMLSEVEPDIISVCVPPAAHADIVIGCAESGIPDAIHCEKPMALTWGEAREMAAVAEENGVQLTFNHQRRFGGPFRVAKKLLDDGRVGTLERIELGGENLYDYGTHLFDLAGYFTDQSPAKWVLAQIDYRDENLLFGAHNENQAISHWQYENGVHGVASTGRNSFLNAQVRLVGSDGVLEIGHEDGPPLRMLASDTEGWIRVDTGGDDIHGPVPDRKVRLTRAISRRVPVISPDWFDDDSTTYIERAIEEIVESLAAGQTSELSASNALQATELIFASWESAHKRQRIDLPLDIESNPLEEMVAAGELPVTGV
ncbi:Gfo/Idh/MocA family protein (plasmid) [Haloferax sp. S1W]|uniref:Gfo/Idh/MocA family protein n=1 Tax=Haloferax sp. S1W TaxID=3377110 RepID=UPI0037CB5DAB